MKLRWIVAAAAVAAGALAARRRNQKIAAQGQTWSAATDPVTPAAEC